MRLTEIHPMPYDANVDPVELVSADPSRGIKLRFDRPLEEAPAPFSIVRLPMLHLLYPQRKIAIPESWGEFDPDLYDYARQNMTVALSCEPPRCNEPIVDSDCLAACNEDCDNEWPTCLSCISECQENCEPKRASCLAECPADCVAAC
jgi:hypothetical protein